MKQFKARCSSIGKIVNLTSLTDKQLEDVAKYSLREHIIGKGELTDNQKEELKRLKAKRDNPELMTGAKTFLRDWFAYKVGLDKGTVFSKEMQKGIIMEDSTIELIDDVIFGSQSLIKNLNKFENDFIDGTPDVIGNDFILDVKSPWDSKTFYDKIIEEVNNDYVWQLKGYCLLANKEKGVLGYGLVNTPTYACLMASFQGKRLDQLDFESTYEHISESERVLAYNIPILSTDEDKIKKAVLMCRDYLNWYEGLIKEKLGNVNNI
jgi:hypothetical protein